jgi:hypothetical protein
MNWVYLLATFMSLLLLAWVYFTISAPRTWHSVYVSFGLLLLAGVNSVAPIRGVIDPAYLGYHFGLLHAQRGLLVTAMSGTVFLLAAAAAFVAARNRPGSSMWLVAVSCMIFAVINGIPWLEALLSDPAMNQIQFGEYVTIPGWVASAILGLLFVVPFILGVPWAIRRANNRSV